MPTKHILKSRTFWGAVVSALPSILTIAGVASGPAGAVATIAGAAYAIYGRAKAQRAVHVRKPRPAQIGE